MKYLYSKPYNASKALLNQEQPIETTEADIMSGEIQVLRTLSVNESEEHILDLLAAEIEQLFHPHPVPWSPLLTEEDNSAV